MLSATSGALPALCECVRQRKNHMSYFLQFIALNSFENQAHPDFSFKQFNNHTVFTAGYSDTFLVLVYRATLGCTGKLWSKGHQRVYLFCSDVFSNEGFFFYGVCQGVNPPLEQTAEKN